MDQPVSTKELRDEIEEIDGQIIDLIANDVKHIHVYSMNKPDVAEAIQRNLSEILKI